MKEFSKELTMIAYYLSENSDKGAKELGYRNQSEALKELSILFNRENNYLKLRRDEFDPLTNSDRKGFWKREVAKDVQRVYDELKVHTFEEITKIIKEITEARKVDRLSSVVALETLVDKVNKDAKKAQKLSDEKLDLSIKNINPVPTKKEVISVHIARDARVSEKTKRRANGKCNLCGNDAPFKKDDDTPFLETHHVITLANDGPDQIYNTVALCPNCHRKMHVLNDPRDVAMLADVIYKYLLTYEERKFLDEFDKLFR